MARLSQTQTAALATWWLLAEKAGYGGFTSTDTVTAAADLAAAHGAALTFTEGTAIATLYGYARRMANAASEVQQALDTAVIGPEHIGMPPWARDEQVMLTTPIWHAGFQFTFLDAAGVVHTEFRTSVFEMTLPQTIGELTAAILEDAQAMADKYGVTLVDAVLHEILAV